MHQISANMIRIRKTTARLKTREKLYNAIKKKSSIS